MKKKEKNPIEQIEIFCLAYGATLREVLGKSRVKHLVDIRCAVVDNLRRDGYSIGSIAMLLHRTPSTIHNLIHRTVDKKVNKQKG